MHENSYTRKYLVALESYSLEDDERLLERYHELAPESMLRAGLKSNNLTALVGTSLALLTGYFTGNVGNQGKAALWAGIGYVSGFTASVWRSWKRGANSEYLAVRDVAYSRGLLMPQTKMPE